MIMNELIDPTAARLERELKHARPLIGCRFDPSGRFLFVSAEDDSIQRFDLLTGVKVALEGHRSWVRGMAVIGEGPVSNAFDAWEHHRANIQALTGFGASTLPLPKLGVFNCHVPVPFGTRPMEKSSI